MASEDIVLVDESSMTLVSSPLPREPPTNPTISPVSYWPHSHIQPPCSPSATNPGPASNAPFPLPLRKGSDNSCRNRSYDDFHDPSDRYGGGYTAIRRPSEMQRSTYPSCISPADPIPPPEPSTRREREGPFAADTGFTSRQSPHNAVHFLPPPPPRSPPSPPPPPPTLPHEPNARKVYSAAELIPAHYSRDPVLETSLCLRIGPFSRTVLPTTNSAQPTDFKQHEWLLRYGETERWYSKPPQYELTDGTKWVKGQLDPLPKSRPACLQVPNVRVSAALTTPMDHNMFASRTDGKSKASEAASLTYHLVFSTIDMVEDCAPHHSGFNPVGEKIYRLLQLGSRQAAIAEVFYTAATNGWSLEFSCVTRNDETLNKAGSYVQKVEDLMMLAEEQPTTTQEKMCRVFY